MKKRGKLSTILLVLVLIVGLSLLLYPSVSEWWNERFQSRAISSYTEQIARIDNDQYQELWESARAYNESLLERKNNFILTEEQRAAYKSELNFNDSGILGYIEIPSIGVTLAVYHTTDDPVLATAVGHLEWTSLPTGGPSTHCVLSGHRGLPSARLFTDLDKLGKGDFFILHILDEELTYEVDQILIVDPDNTDHLLIEEGKDLCTLVTCTPYGVNSHRLLVRGHRVDSIWTGQNVRVTADAVIIEKLVVAPFVLVPILLVMFVWLLFATRKRKQ